MDQSPVQYHVSRSIGEATVTVISFGSFWNPHTALHAPTVEEEEWRRVLADADVAGRTPQAHTVVHVSLDGASVLIDTAARDDIPEVMARAAGLVRTPGIVAGLAQIGVQPDQITHVVLTHSHFDHLGGAVDERDGVMVPRFPNAAYLVNRHDWDDNPDRLNPESHLMIRLGPIEQAGLLELVDGDFEVAPGVQMIHAPGESPGHSVVRLESSGHVFYALGDLIHHPCHVERPGWLDDSFPGRDAAAMLASRRRILGAAASEEALVTYAHVPFPPHSPFGRIVQTVEGFRWEAA